MNLPDPLCSREQRRSNAARERLADVRTFLQDHLVGADALVERLLIGLLADGHILIEGAPGLAKTRAVKLLARALDLCFRAHPMHARSHAGRHHRHVNLAAGSRRIRIRGGADFPFARCLSTKSIARRPKVQSALLEAMAERQATVAGETRALPDPFMVIATQNPIEQEGTFPLPEAQLDRFMLHVELALPDAATERSILDLVEQE